MYWGTRKFVLRHLEYNKNYPFEAYLKLYVLRAYKTHFVFMGFVWFFLQRGIISLNSIN
jgi:hypothetical protein